MESTAQFLSRTRRRLPWLLSSVDAPEQIVGYVGPNWYASVMGTGIVANAAMTLPWHVAFLRVFALAVWGVDLLLLGALTVAVVLHWVLHPSVARSHAYDPTMAQFYGAPPMALLTVGAGAVLVGKTWLGLPLAVDLDWVLWGTGTILGLIAAVAIPYLMFTHHDIEADGAFGGWIMPIVPPMVSAATGAVLIPHVAAGALRATFVYGLYSMFGMSLVVSLIVITLIWSRLVHHGDPGTARSATLWIVLGPLGQSITAASLLGNAAHLALPPQIANGMDVMAVLYGVPVWGFATLWVALAVLLTVRAVRRGFPFALTWWSFTFPVGTYVTGTSGLALHTGLPAFAVAAVVAYAGLLGAWAIVAARTLHGGVRGELLLRPAVLAPASS
ncbi:MAG: TDT family transporter [Candidatus Dormibacteria bacterium]